MKDIVLNGSLREIKGKQVKALRREGKLPAVIYGRGYDPLAITLDEKEARHVLKGVTSSHLIVLSIAGKKHNVLVKDKQYHPLTSAWIHLDFQEVRLTEKLRVNVTLTLEGEAPAVKEFNGVVVSGVEELEVEALPRDLPDTIRVDLSVLKKIGDAVYVKDIVPPEKVVILTEPDEMIVLITAPISEAEVAEIEAVTVEAAGGEPEVIERGKKEEEEF